MSLQDALGRLPARFTIQAAHVRYNPPSGDKSMIQVEDDETGVFGILTLIGWNRENARIEGCTFERDESLEPGTMVLRPLDAG